MGSEQPVVLIATIAATGVAIGWWWQDYRAARSGRPNERAFPGAKPAGLAANLVAVAGAIVLLAAETVGEKLLGIDDQQSRITVLFGVFTLAAAFLEELIFRGYIVVENRGSRTLWCSIIAASLAFALLHPFLWSWSDGALQIHLTAKAFFSTAAAFAGSIWFYVSRFNSLNVGRSLLPCIAAHAVKNLGVFAVKLNEGYVAGWW